MKTIAEVIESSLRGKRVEPKQRWVGGKFGYAIHRFPIKGGITLADVWAENICKSNALLSLLKKRGD